MDVKDTVSKLTQGIRRRLPKSIKKPTGESVKSFIKSLPARLRERKERRRHSLMTWLSLCFLVFSLITLVVLLTFQTLFFDSSYKAIKIRNLTQCASSIKSNVGYGDVQRLMLVISSQNDVDAILCDHDDFANFHRAYASIINDVSMIDDLSTAELNDYFVKARNNDGSFIDVIKNPAADSSAIADRGEFRGDIPAFERDNEERLIYAESFSLEGKEYLLLLESVVTPSMSTTQTLLFQLRIIMFILIAFSVLMTVSFTKMISKPLENINNSAKELAQGNYDVVFSGSGYREVEQLSDTLNYATSELRQVDQMRKDLIANVSHDLRTPLTLITGYGEVMRDIPGENTPENIQIIIDEATRLTSLVNDLIDISKIEAGTMKLEATVFCITDTIKEMFGRYNKLKEQDGYSFTLEHDQDVYVYADQLKISQVIYNLVNNAVNYCGDSKAITVRQTCYDNRVRIEVIDNGPGIPPEKLKNIWDRYYKVDKLHKSAKIGTGLGLSIVKTVLKLHKAQFGVFSKVGQGTVFWFELPRTNKDGEPM